VLECSVTWAGLVLRNLSRRPVRTLLTAAGVALGVALIVALLSISAGTQRTASDLIHVGRSDFGLFQSGVADATRSLLPVSLERQVARDPDVAQAAGIFLLVAKPGLVIGLDPRQFTWQRMTLVRGSRDGALIGDRFPGRVGETLVLEGRSFRVGGVFHTGDRFEDNGIVLPLPAVQQLAKRPGEVTSIGVTVRLGARPADVAKRLERRYGVTAIVEPGQAVKVDTSSRVILSVGWVISVLALIVGGIGVTNTMAMSVFERVGEIGVLRAIGWRGRRIAALIVCEALGIALLALALGLALGVLAAYVFADRSGLSSLVTPRFTAGVFAWGLAFALGVGVTGAAYPTWRALRLSPIEALRAQ
jgi:putative ABC transport system permease protein